MKQNQNVTVVLLAGGTGSRMKSEVPKQFLPIKDKVVARHSFDLFASMPEVKEIVVVCAPEYRHHFLSHSSHTKLTFAMPGERRQDSTYNGLMAVQTDCSLICVHDSARPLINIPLIRRVIEAAMQHGAATAGMPVKFTIKECNTQHFVERTPDRALIWEIQTPQVIQAHLLKEGFKHALRHKLSVTDDVSLVELLNLPVKLVEGCYTNLKITTPDDLDLTQHLMNK